MATGGATPTPTLLAELAELPGEQFRQELPKTATGKVRKFVLREEAKEIELA